jgi:hypothetical protein
MRRLDVERRNTLESFSFAERRAIEEKGTPEERAKLRENNEKLKTLGTGLLFLEWLGLRSKAAQLGLFLDWSETRADELFADKESETVRREISELRLAIRNERNERWKYWELRLKVITAFVVALTGAIGAAIGLVATFRR